VTHHEALAALRALVEANEGCPVAAHACQCPSSEECIIGAVLETETFPDAVTRGLVRHHKDACMTRFPGHECDCHD
jgi:hypothetical protein